MGCGDLRPSSSGTLCWRELGHVPILVSRSAPEAEAVCATPPLRPLNALVC
jgi:hypothetical protein